MKLEEFLSTNQLTYKGFAKIAGLTKNIIVNAIHGRPVGLIAALKIEKASYGRVKPVELVKPEVAEREGLN